MLVAIFMGMTMNGREATLEQRSNQTQWTHQSALFQLFDYGGDLFLKIEHHSGPLLVQLKHSAQ